MKQKKICFHDDGPHPSYELKCKKNTLLLVLTFFVHICVDSNAILTIAFIKIILVSFLKWDEDSVATFIVKYATI